MQSPSRQFLRQKTTFRARFEHLERRDCPSCTVFQKEQTLTIVGDRLDNHIDIAAVRAGDGSVRVACDGSVRTFTGLKMIDLKSHTGDDEISVNFLDPPAPILQLRADLGAGHDLLNINWFVPIAPQDATPPEATGPDSRPQYALDIAAGAGHDRVNIDWINPADTPADVTIHTNLGAGDDEFMFCLEGTTDGRYAISTDGGAGNDDFNVELEELTIDGQFMMSNGGGAGDDEFMMNLGDLKISGGFMMDTDAGAGDDTYMMNLGDLKISGDFMMNIAGGAGDDRMSGRLFTSPGTISGFDPQPDPPATIDFAMSGGAGDDRLSVLVGDPHRGTPSEHAVGDPHVQLDLLGGPGDDDLTLAVYGLDDSLLTALVDGGRGFDTARVTQNVRVADCEKMIFVDEPR